MEAIARIGGRRHADSSPPDDVVEIETFNRPAGITEDVADSDNEVELAKWNKPRGNAFRFVASCFSMFVMGLNDGANGALIPYLEKYYNIGYTVASLIFLCPFAGYTVAAFTNATIHAHLGQRGIAIAAPACHIINYVVLSLHPPFPVLAAATVIGGLGNGLIDGAWSAWAGHMQKGNALEGILHSFYAVGCTFSPLIATVMITQAGLMWYEFYYFMLGVSVVEFILCTVTFWRQTGLRYREEHSYSTEGGSNTRKALTNKVTWLCSAFFLVYVGSEVSVGGWTVTFMLRTRHASAYASGMSATGFWAGMTFGRAVLGFVTEYLSSHHGIHERYTIMVYLIAAIALQLVFWLVPRFIASAIAVAFLGIFLGPMFPSGIIMATKMLPKDIHISSVGFSTAIGGAGGGIFPFIVGAIAQSEGVQTLQPIVLAMLGVLVLLWLLFPKPKTRNE